MMGCIQNNREKIICGWEGNNNKNTGQQNKTKIVYTLDCTIDIKSQFLKHQRKDLNIKRKLRENRKMIYARTKNISMNDGNMKEMQAIIINSYL